MILSKDYVYGPYQFRFEKDGNGYQLYYSYNSNLSETKKREEKLNVEQKNLRHVKTKLDRIIRTKKPKSLDDLRRELGDSENKEEIDELIDSEGNLNSSKIPPLNFRLTPRKTIDQTVAAATMPNNPITRGYRKYYGEGKVTKNKPSISEVDYSDAFGYEETKDMNGEDTYRFLVKNMDMEPEEAVDRTKQFGKDPSGKKTKNTDPRIRQRKGFIDRLTLSEIEKQKMTRLVDEILLNKKSRESELSEKEKKTPTIIKKNVEVLKKMAEKQGITTNELIRLIKNE
jgi:hypothetical protein